MIFQQKILFPAETGESVVTDSPDAAEKDENGHVIKLSHYDGSGKLVFVHTREWGNDRIVKKTSYDGKGKLTGVDYMGS